MGMNHEDIEVINLLAERGYLKPRSRIVEIGAQQLSNSFFIAAEAVRKAEELFQAPGAYHLRLHAQTGDCIHAEATLSDDAPLSRDFWETLGFDYSAIDLDGSPGSIPLDLNFDCVPIDLQQKHNLVTNLGTTEHICNQLNAFRIIHDLAAPGGVMMHHLPTGGSLNHGLINYTPKFFWYLARSNDYRFLYMNYVCSGIEARIPDNLVEAVREYDSMGADRLQHATSRDDAIIVAFQKVIDIPFVPPIDVRSGAEAHGEIRQRYWTVFQPDLLEDVRRGQMPPTKRLVAALRARRPRFLKRP